MKVEPCTLHDIQRIELTYEQMNEDPRLLLPDGIDPATFDALLIGSSWSIMSEEGIPIACFGLVVRWPGVAEVWALYAMEALNKPKELLRITREKLDWCESTYKIRRFQTSVREDFSAAHRWIMRLGFIPEGRMPGYGSNGATHILYGRVR